MYGVIIGLIIVICILLVLVVLAQNAKGGGLSSQFGGSAASNIIGVKKTGDLLEKLTWTFIVAIFVLSLATNFVDESVSSGGSIIDNTPNTAPATPTPNLLEGQEAPASDSAGN
jgi:preprotein translocase subunit SecG